MKNLKIICSREYIVRLLNRYNLTKSLYPNYLLFLKNIKVLNRLLFDKQPHFLEIHAADHCNLNCYGCSHYSSISEERYLDLQNLEINLKHLQKVSKYFKEVRIMGGEPLLHPEIIRIMETVRGTFKHNQISLLSNGILLKRMNEEFWAACKKNNIELKITIYPNVNVDSILQILDDKEVKYSFYADRKGTHWEALLLNEKKSKNALINYYRCGGYQECWQLYDNKIIGCSTSAYAFNLNRKFGSNFQLDKKDYLPVDESLSRRKLLWFSFRVKKFCKYCVFPRKTTNWQKTGYSASEWICNQ